ncbi:engulfment and cell motility protein 2-like [Liolophura sinensis]|uniref:engulfment and cell motility protein 2-like n=1 Tax=Liolophura sinensis TaxID=3198878 RepID=UPI003158695A
MNRMESRSSQDRQLRVSTMPQLSENIKKVAIIMPGEETQFINLDQNRPLAAIIQDISEKWKLTEPNNFSLQFTDATRQTFITERNRLEIQNGNVLAMTDAPSRTAELTLGKLTGSNRADKIEALKKLAQLSSDITFATEFINRQGLQLLIKIVVDAAYSGEPLAYTLQAFIQLMDHGIVSWDVLEEDFVKRVADCVNMAKKVDVVCLKSSLEILESVLLHSSRMCELVERAITPTSITPHLQDTSTEVQKNGIALINALFLRADPVKRKNIAKSLQSTHIRNIFLNNVIRGEHKGAEMAHQLCVLQSNLINQLEENMNTPADPKDQEQMKAVEELQKVAFDIEIDPTVSLSRRTGNPALDFKKLGFVKYTKPIEEFMEVPPGRLALDNLVYYAKHHEDAYRKLVLENSVRGDEHDCPVAQAAVALTKRLCTILKVGDTDTEEGQVYYPMFFCHDRPFEEFFCACMYYLNKTWKEMRATAADFKKVLEVVQEQVTRALQVQPTSFEAFRVKMGQLSYSEIMKIWEVDRQSREEMESQAVPIVELREQIKPDIIQLIKQNRLNYLLDGTVFVKHNNKGRMKDKYWFCRLSPNLKTFHYGDCEETANPPIESLPHKLNIVDIRNVLIGRDCPHIKERRRQTAPVLAFAIIPDTSVSQEALCFMASNQNEYDMWVDGLNALLNKPMTSMQTKSDLDTLIGMEIKLRLLDIEGVPIPTNPPPIPKPPSNYNFVYQY